MIAPMDQYLLDGGPSYSLAALWPCDDAMRGDTDPLVALDGHDLAYVGDATGMDSPVVGGGQAASFGVGDYASAASIGSLSVGSNRSFSAWVRFDDLSASRGIFGLAASGTGYFDVMHTSGGAIRVRTRVGGIISSFDAPSSTITTGTWYYLTATLSSAYVCGLMLNGVAVAGSTGTIGIGASSPLTALGGNTIGLTMQGAMRSASYHNTALSAAQVFGILAANFGRYDIYSRPTPTGADTLVGSVLGNAALTYTVTGLDGDSTRYYWVRAVSRFGVADTAPVAGRLRRAAIDSGGNLIDPAPNAPYQLRLITGPAGQVTARWAYRGTDAEAAAAKFNVYVATGASYFDFDTPDHTLATVQLDNTQDLGTFADTTVVRAIVRAATTDDTEETNTTEATATADTTAPAVPASLTVTAEAS